MEKKIPRHSLLILKLRTVVMALSVAIVVFSGVFFLSPTHNLYAKQFDPFANCYVTYEPGQIGYIGQCYGTGLDMYCDIPICAQAGVDCFTEHLYCPDAYGSTGAPSGYPVPPAPVISIITVTITGLSNPNVVNWDVLPDPGDSGTGTGNATIGIQPDPAGTTYTITGLSQTNCSYSVTNNVNGSGPSMYLYPNANAQFNVAYTCTTPTTVSLSAQDASVVSGGSTNLTWSTTGNPAYCTASGAWSGTKAGGGGTEAVTNITQNPTTYLITCYDSLGNPSNTASVSVGTHSGPLPLSPTGLNATPSSSCGTGTISISWNSSVGASSYTLKDFGSVIYTGPSTSFTNSGLADGTSHSYTVSASNAGGSSADSSAVSTSAPPSCPATPTTATINVVEVGATGGCWYVYPGFYESSPFTVTPDPTYGTTYTLYSCGAPGGYTVTSINSSDGGNSLNVLPGQSKQFTINYAGNTSGSVSVYGRQSYIGGFNYGPITIPSGSYVDVAWYDSNTNATCYLSSSPATSFSGPDSYTGSRYGVGPITTQTSFTANCPGDSGPAPFVVNVTQPDLTAGLPTPNTASAGVPVTLSSLISNGGNGSTITSFNNQFTVYNAANGGGTPTVLTATSMTPLAAGTGNTTTASYTFPSAGTYSIKVCADSTNAVAESNESNNCSTSTGWVNVTVAPPVPVVTLSANPTTGTQGVVNPQLTWTTTNSPTSCTASGDWSGSKSTSGGNESEGVLNTVRVYTYTLTCANAGGNSTPVSVTVTVTAPTTATINVAEYGASGGSWTISPGGFTGTSNVVTPGSTGTTYSLTSNTTPSGYVVSSITSSDGPGSLFITPGQVKQFSITYGPATPFDYSISNSGNLTATQDVTNVIVQETIPLTLVQGSTQGVTLSLSGVPAGVSTSIAANGCSPTCTATVSFTVHPTDPDGISTITVTGSPLNHATSFNLTIKPAAVLIVIDNPSEGGGGSCSGSTNCFVGDQVTWTCVASGGVPPYTYVMNGTDFPSPSPTNNPFIITYQTVGAKTGTCTVTDNIGQVATSPVSTVNISLNPKFKEF